MCVCVPALYEGQLYHSSDTLHHLFVYFYVLPPHCWDHEHRPPCLTVLEIWVLSIKLSKYFTSRALFGSFDVVVVVIILKKKKKDR